MTYLDIVRNCPGEKNVEAECSGRRGGTVSTSADKGQRTAMTTCLPKNEQSRMKTPPDTHAVLSFTSELLICIILFQYEP